MTFLSWRTSPPIKRGKETFFAVQCCAPVFSLRLCQRRGKEAEGKKADTIAIRRTTFEIHGRGGGRSGVVGTKGLPLAYCGIRIVTD